MGGIGDNALVELGPYGLAGASGNLIITCGSDLSLIAGSGDNSGVTLNSGQGSSMDNWSIGGSLIATAGPTSGITMQVNVQMPTPTLAATYSIANNLTVTVEVALNAGGSSCFALFFNGDMHVGGDVVFQGGN